MKATEKYFEVQDVAPGIINTPEFGDIHLSELSVERAVVLMNRPNGFAYLKLTKDGEAYFADLSAKAALAATDTKKGTIATTDTKAGDTGPVAPAAK